MNKVLREAYFHICNGGAFIRVEEDEKTKEPVFVVDWNTFGNLKTTFNMLTRKGYLRILGEMLIEAADMCGDPSDSYYKTIAKFYHIKDGDKN